MSHYLVTGAAGFIGFHLCRRLLASGQLVVGVDNLNDYYSVDLKRARLAQLTEGENFEFRELDLSDRQATSQLFAGRSFSRVLHMAAQAGVRYSLDNPHAYVDSNLVGFMNMLEGCRHTGVEHLVYASSSSVYGANQKVPFSEEDRVDYPISLYAATKKANELMAHTYSHLYQMPTTGLRFFTVYGPWGRPDMAYYKFTGKILRGEPIDVYNHGRLRRDFTYIDDIVEGVLRVADHLPGGAEPVDCPVANEGPASPLHRVYNIGNSQPVELEHFISILENVLGRAAHKTYLPMQPADMPQTYADIRALSDVIDFRPETSIEDGLTRFCAWYQEYHNLH